VVNAKLKVIMDKAFAEVLAQSEKHGVNMRTGAYLNAVQCVADATALRGLYP
jgi:glutamate dehydrogenase/leucine dehydrogenase